MYPYIEPPHLDDIMSLITSTTISWGTNPGVTSSELTELNFFFFLGYLVIVFDPFHMYILFPLRDVHSYTLSSLMLL